MLPIFIIFFLFCYLLGEIFKIRFFRSFKNRRTVFNKPLVYIKLVSICIVFVLLIINHFISTLERSSNVFMSIYFFVFIILLILLSVRDVKKAKEEEEI